MNSYVICDSPMHDTDVCLLCLKLFPVVRELSLAHHDGPNLIPHRASFDPQGMHPNTSPSTTATSSAGTTPAAVSVAIAPQTSVISIPHGVSSSESSKFQAAVGNIHHPSTALELTPQSILCFPPERPATSNMQPLVGIPSTWPWQQVMPTSLFAPGFVEADQLFGTAEMDLTHLPIDVSTMQKYCMRFIDTLSLGALSLAGFDGNPTFTTQDNLPACHNHLATTSAVDRDLLQSVIGTGMYNSGLTFNSNPLLFGTINNQNAAIALRPTAPAAPASAAAHTTSCMPSGLAFNSNPLLFGTINNQNAAIALAPSAPTVPVAPAPTPAYSTTGMLSAAASNSPASTNLYDIFTPPLTPHSTATEPVRLLFSSHAVDVSGRGPSPVPLATVATPTHAGPLSANASRTPRPIAPTPSSPFHPVLVRGDTTNVLTASHHHRHGPIALAAAAAAASISHHPLTPTSASGPKPAAASSRTTPRKRYTQSKVEKALLLVVFKHLYQRKKPDKGSHKIRGGECRGCGAELVARKIDSTDYWFHSYVARKCMHFLVCEEAAKLSGVKEVLDRFGVTLESVREDIRRKLESGGGGGVLDGGGGKGKRKRGVAAPEVNYFESFVFSSWD
ncbi:hypothetical protein HDU96_010965 [Phlyctochytrium bullatum]|nr:hypothetical protein HDU96_010965 [Phlyctochytrium bullatum]